MGWKCNSKTITPCLKAHGEYEEFLRLRNEAVKEQQEAFETPEEKMANRFLSEVKKMKILEGMGYVSYKNALYKKSELPSERGKTPAKVERVQKENKAEAVSPASVHAATAPAEVAEPSPVEEPVEIIKSVDLLEWIFNSIEDDSITDDIAISQVGHGGLGYLKALKNHEKLMVPFYARYFDRLDLRAAKEKLLADDGRVLTKIDQLTESFIGRSESDSAKLMVLQGFIEWLKKQKLTIEIKEKLDGL